MKATDSSGENLGGHDGGEGHGKDRLFSGAMAVSPGCFLESSGETRKCQYQVPSPEILIQLAGVYPGVRVLQRLVGILMGRQDGESLLERM
jgi:hypothetical protein